MNGDTCMKTRALLFDFDGTLVDTMEGFADIAGEVIHQFHPEISYEEARRRYLETSGVPFFQQLEIILPGNPANSKKAAIFEETKKEGFFRSTFSEEVRFVITQLRERGMLVGVSSNNFQYLIEQFIEREGLQFDIVLGFKNGFEKGKHHFEYVLHHFHLKKDELTFVGDSLKDAEKAISNDISFIGLCSTFTKDQFLDKYPDIITINSLKELLDICER